MAAREPGGRTGLGEATLVLGAVDVVGLDVIALELVEALERAARRPGREGRQRVAAVAGHAGLSVRQAEVLTLIAQGLRNHDIAGRLYLSVNSVKTHIRTLYRSIGVTRRSEAVLWAINHGFGPSAAPDDSDDSGAWTLVAGAVGHCPDVKNLLRGLVAGAAGTTVLNVVTYLDMALTGRPASSGPADTVDAAADLVGLDLPSQGSRDEAYGALSGLGVGVGIGAVAALVRSAGVRLPWLAESAVIGFGAMAATDGPMAVLKVTDLTTWSGTDWARDVVPHLAYGATVAASLRAVEPDDADEQTTDQGPAKPGRLLLRSVAIGLASGARSSLGTVPPGLVGGPVPALVSAGLVGTELVFDKLPSTPTRVGGPTAARVLTAAAGSAVLARKEGAAGVFPAMAAAALGAIAGTIAGSVWRDYAADRGWDVAGAIGEDVASLALTLYAVKG